MLWFKQCSSRAEGWTRDYMQNHSGYSGVVTISVTVDLSSVPYDAKAVEIIVRFALDTNRVPPPPPPPSCEAAGASSHVSFGLGLNPLSFASEIQWPGPVAPLVSD